MKVLLVQTAFLGDTILSTPLIAALHERYPDAELWMMTTPLAAPLLRLDPLLTGVIEFHKRAHARGISGMIALAKELRGHQFNIVYSVHRSARTALLLRLAGIPVRVGFKRARMGFLYTDRRDRPSGVHDRERNLALLGDGAAGASRNMRIHAPPLEAIPEWLRAEVMGFPSFVVLAPGSEWRTKRWHWRRYRELAERLLASGWPVVVVGSKAERPVANAVSADLPICNLAGRTDLPQLAWVVSRSAAVVCNDSMMSHLASALSRPVVAIFCATSPMFGFAPSGDRSAIAELSGLWCKPCHRHGLQRCPTGTEACMRDLSSIVVHESLNVIMNEGA